MQCVENMLFLTLEQVIGRIKNLSVYRSTFMLTGKFLQEHFVPPLEVASLVTTRKNHRGSSHLRGIQYRVSIVLA